MDDFRKLLVLLSNNLTITKVLRLSISIIFFWLLTFFPAALLAEQASQTKKKKSKKSELLSLSILPMVNKTGSTNYNYLSDTLSSAIGTQLKEKFTYRPYSNSKAKSSLKSALKKENKKWIDINESHITRLSQQKNIDIVIYGEYNKFKSSGKSDRILIRVGLFLKFEAKTYWLSDVASVDASLFTIIEDVADDVITKISELLIGGVSQEEKFYKMVFRTKKHKNEELNKKLQNEVQELRKYFTSEYKSETMSSKEFEKEYLKTNPETKKLDISKKKKLLKQMKKFKIANLVGVKLKRETVIITISVFGKKKKKREYNINASDEEKERTWNSLVRSLKEKKSVRDKKGRQALVKAPQPEKPRLIVPEFGARVGYLYPVLLGSIHDGQVNSAEGFLIEAYYSFPLNYLYALSDYSDLPELYALTAFERYEIGNTNRNRSITAIRGVLGLGLLYPYYFGGGDRHSLKGGLTIGLAYQSIKVVDITSSSDVSLTFNALSSYGFLYKSINFSISSRVLLSPGKGFSVLGFNLSFGAGYLL